MHCQQPVQQNVSSVCNGEGGWVLGWKVGYRLVLSSSRQMPPVVHSQPVQNCRCVINPVRQPVSQRNVNSLQGPYVQQRCHNAEQEPTANSRCTTVYVLGVVNLAGCCWVVGQGVAGWVVLGSNWRGRCGSRGTRNSIRQQPACL